MSPILPLRLKTSKPKHPHYPKEIKTVGDELRTVRLDRKLTQEQIAQQLGVNRNFIYEMELGHHMNTIYALHKVFLFFGFLPKTLKINETTLRGQLFAHRMRNGLTYQAVAKMIGLDKSTIARYERGQIVKAESQFKIIEYFEKDWTF